MGARRFKVLAGPVLRRSDSMQVCVWIATDQKVIVDGVIYEADPCVNARAKGDKFPAPLGKGSARSLRFGDNLFLSLVRIVPVKTDRKLAAARPFPYEVVLGYDLSIRNQDSRPATALTLAVLFPGAGEQGLSYAPYPFPTFLLRSEGRINLLHGSCRKLHGVGEDLLGGVDDVLRHSLPPSPQDPNHPFSSETSLIQRPTALYLTGDQIYADDVAEPLAEHILQKARELLGWHEEMPISDRGKSGIPLDGIGRCGGRARLLNTPHAQSGKPMFSSGEARNHLIGFGEFAAVYLMAWNDAAWPEALPDAPRCMDFSESTYKDQLKALDLVRKALPRVRRALANIPVYMVFDDHEITDDWNVSFAWQEEAKKRPVSRRIIANGLLAYWAFQAWGNDPDRFDEKFIDAMLASLESQDRRPADFEKVLLDFARWTFVTPPHPRTIFLDERTEREFDSATGPARLLSVSALHRLVKLIGPLTGTKVPVFIVAGAPVIGMSIMEDFQEELLVPKDETLGDPYATDPESWHANRHSFYKFQAAVAEALRGPCVFLSGDVHYGFVALSDFKQPGRPWSHFVQFTSSALKNAAGKGAEFAAKVQEFLAGGVAASYRIWLNPPSANAAKQSKEVPVWVLEEVIAAFLEIAEPADYRQRIRFAGLPIRDPAIGTSNLGQLIVRPDLRAQLIFHVGERGDPFWVQLQLDGGVHQPGLDRG